MAFCNSRSIWSITAVLAITAAVFLHSAPGSMRDTLREISFYELRDQYSVRGRLERPFGERVILEGECYMDNTTNRRFPEMSFFVRKVDGRVLPEAVIFRVSDVSGDFDLVNDVKRGRKWHARGYETIAHTGHVPLLGDERDEKLQGGLRPFTLTTRLWLYRIEWVDE